MRDTVPRKPNGIPAVESAMRGLFVLLPLRRARVAAARALAGTPAVGNGSSSGGMTTGETTTSGGPGY